MTVPTTPPITSALTLDSVSSAERQILARRTSKTVRRGSLRPPSSISMTCGMANSPIRAAMIWTPPSSSSVKMKRSTPWIESEPIMAIHRPIQPASSPLTTDFDPACDDRHAQDRDPEQVRGSEFERPGRQHRRQEDQHQNAEDAADRRGDEADLQGARTGAPARHDVAVERGRDVGRRTGNVEQDRAHRPSRDGRGIGRAQQHQALGRVHVEGEGDQQRDRHGRRQARRRAEQQAADRAGAQDQHGGPCEDRAEMVEKFQTLRPASFESGARRAGRRPDFALPPHGGRALRNPLPNHASE